MGLGEFDLIRRWFTRPVARAELGVGDDCALLRVRPGHVLAVSSDMLVEGRHFLPSVAPQRLGHKALAVNLSDLAACGAQPLAFTLALALPRVDPAFLEPLAEGLWALAAQHDIELVGGDTTAGPLNLCLTVMGEVPQGQALLRSGARVGDGLWVSGRLGDARLALDHLLGEIALPPAELEPLRLALECPQPRVALGIALRGLASSAIDLSDGLLGDLGHVLAASRVAARIDATALPCSEALRRQPEPRRTRCLLAGGDDYELLFTAPERHRAAVLEAGARTATPVTCIGQIVPGTGVQVVDAAGRPIALDGLHGFDHFAGP